MQCCRIWGIFPIWGSLRYELGIIKHHAEIPQTLYFGGNLDLPGNIWIFSVVWNVLPAKTVWLVFPCIALPWTALHCSDGSVQWRRLKPVLTKYFLPGRLLSSRQEDINISWRHRKGQEWTLICWTQSCTVGLACLNSTKKLTNLILEMYWPTRLKSMNNKL
jgi:hypothetical protein